MRGSRSSRRALRVGTRSIALIASVTTVMGLAACGGSSGGSSSGSGSSGSDALSIGLVGFDATTVAAQREADAAEKAMKDEGWDVKSQDPAGDAAKANGICQQYAAQHVDAIVVDVFQGPQMAQCLNSAKSSDIPVFFIASALADGMAGAISTTVAEPINELFLKSIEGKTDNVNILTLEFSPGAPCLARAKGLNEGLQSAGVKESAVSRHEVTIPGQVPDSQAATTAWLNAHPEKPGQTLAIWSCFSDAALGAVAALRQAGRTVPIHTWDLTKQIVPLVQDGTISATAISDADKLSQELISMIKDNKAGTGKPEEVSSGALVLDKSTIDDYVANNPVS